MQNQYPKECFETTRSRHTLKPRGKAYHFLMGPCCALGFFRYIRKPPHWFARYRQLNGRYAERRLGYAEELHPSHDWPALTFEQARAAAQDWFDSPEVRANSRRGDNYVPPGGLCVCPIGDVYTVSHAIVDYLDWALRFRASRNHDAMRCQSNKYIIPLIGSLSCEELTASDVRSVPLLVESTPPSYGQQVVHRQIDPNSLTAEERRRRRVTANHVLNVLKWALRAAFDEGRIRNDWAWRSVKGFRHVDKNRIDYLSWREAKALVDAAKPDLRRLILAGLYTGCRVSELYQIKASDLMQTRMAIYIHPMKTYRGRTIALPEEGYYFFKALARGKAKDEILLLRENGTPWKTAYLSEIFRPLKRRLGIPDSFVFHNLRHTYASLLLQAGTPPIVVARQLGHINMHTVIKTYSHVVDDFYDDELRHRFKPNFLSQPDLFSNALPGENTLAGV